MTLEAQENVLRNADVTVDMTSQNGGLLLKHLNIGNGDAKWIRY